MRSRSRLRTALVILTLLGALFVPRSGVAQSDQYRMAGVLYRSQRDTGAVARAAQAYRTAPTVENAIALGTAQAGLRQFREAIATFTRALERFPDEPLLYRWRGHRHLTLRDFIRARADLETALGLDSALYGAWYHLGVVRFADGEFAEAAQAFARALPLAPNVGERAGSVDWLWMSLSRDGRAEEATALLARRPDSIPANNAYEKRLRLYRGEITPDAVIGADDTADVQRATLSYGIGNWFAVRHDTVRARAWFERAIASGGWPAFGAIIAEAELAGRTTWADRVRRERYGSACVRAIPDTELARAVISATINWGDAPASPALRDARAQVGLLLQEATASVRRDLGGPPDILPRGDARYSWRLVRDSVTLVVRRDGSVGVRVPRQRALAGTREDSSADAGVVALARALTDVHRGGTAPIAWPAELVGDSLEIRVRLEYPPLSLRDASPDSAALGVAVPLFSLPVPLTEASTALLVGAPRYPTDARQARATGGVIVRFVVDTLGLIRPETIREAWDPSVSRQRGKLVLHYDQFRDAVLTAMPEMRFNPAMIGGCKVPQVVKQPFVFDLAR